MAPRRTVILYADDEPRYLRLAGLFLDQARFEVVTAADGQEALEQLGRRPDVDLVILDVLMPRLDGLETCRAIREFSKVPILMLTALGDEGHEIRGLEAGADDYLAKPFSRDRLVTRVRALVRRQGLNTSGTLTSGPVRLDPEAHAVIAGGASIDLSPREFGLLRALLLHPGTVCPRSRLLDQVWGPLYDGDPRTLDTHVKSLRKKLGTEGDRIVTHRGVGYAFRGDAP